MEATVAEKAKVILVGGMDYNIPDELKERFEIVKHIAQGSKYNMLPQAQYIFVITQWANHNIVDQVKRECKIPVIWLRQGWASMKADLQKRSLLPPDASPEVAPQVPASQSDAAPASTLGLSEAEIWKKFGEKMVEACRNVLKLGEKVSQADLLEVLSMAGPPAEDCELFLPKLQMLGIIAPTKNGLWRLASSEEQPYEEESDEVVPVSTPKPRRVAPPADQRSESEERLRRIPGNPALVTKLIASLPRGPYPTKKAIQREMRKYKEFAGLTDNQIRLAVDRAIEQKIVDDTHESLFIEHQNDHQLTAIEKPVVEESEPEVPKVLPTLNVFQAMMAPPPPPPVVLAPQGMSKRDVEEKWCFVLARVKDVRQRLADILTHCRIEWMETNKVLVIFLPAAISNCQRFLESTENWGTISRIVQEHFTRDTVIRFMLDNGLRV
jgi:hypothetical protein